MKGGLRAGLIAGAAGTLALDIAGYADMIVRGRPASELPGTAAARLAERAGVDLGPDDETTTRSRADALGSILGYASGLAIGGAYGVLRRNRRRRRGPAGVRTGVGLGLAAMVATNGPMVAQGLTDPRTWGAAGWISDIVPHVAFGVVTAKAYDAITR